MPPCLPPELLVRRYMLPVPMLMGLVATVDAESAEPLCSKARVRRFPPLTLKP